MKKLLFLTFALCGFFIGMVNAQTTKIYVSRHGGKVNMLTGKIRYNHTRFAYNPGCDTMIGIGKGYSICQIPNGSYNINETTQVAYPIFNKAIKTSARRIKRSNSKTGEFVLKYRKQSVLVKFYNADETGEADLLISLI
ncbi:MAG: hypothetical protein ACKVQV_15205 [Bacteroidia bacterium]